MATFAGSGAGSSQAAVDCYIGFQQAGGMQPTIVDFASTGLDSGVTFLSGLPAAAAGLTPQTGAAFPGANPALGENQMLFPMGRSVYNALLVSLRQDLDHPLPAVRHLNLHASYALSRFESVATDQDFISNALDFNHPLHFFGPSSLDRTHQLSVGGVMDLVGSLRLSFISHWDSALPTTLSLPSSGLPGEIFRTDITGDGTTGDVLPGTNVGSLGRNVKVGDLNSVIGAYNTTMAGALTPAGQALVTANLFTPAQLTTLRAVTPTLTRAPAGQVGLDALKTLDLRLAWILRPRKARESLTIQPMVGVFNLFNFSNFDPPTQTLIGILNGAPGSVNGTTAAQRSNRIGFGTGVFALGAPRVLEWGLRITF